MRGAVFELVAIEIAGGGVGRRAVCAVAAAVFAGGDGFARHGLVDYVGGVGALGGGVEVGLREGKGFGGVVVCRRHVWVGTEKIFDGQGLCSYGQWLSCCWRRCRLLCLHRMCFYQWLMAQRPIHARHGEGS